MPPVRDPSEETPLTFTSGSFRWKLRLGVFLLALAALGSLAGCGPDAPTTGEPSSGQTIERYSGLIAASEFVVGPNRFPFGLVNVNGEFLESAAVNVRFSLWDGEKSTFKTEGSAHWRTIPDNIVHAHEDGEQHLHLDFRGIYVIDEVVLPEPGIWIADFVALADGNVSPVIEEAGFSVLPEANAPTVGTRVPATENLTIDDAPFVDISTRQVEHDELHNVSVAEARDSGEPFVVVFASPQFCVSAMCGPVVEVMDDVREALGGEIEFIHNEPWSLTAARERGELVPSAAILEWRLPSEPWVFVVDREGRVAMRIEGLATEDEVIAALRALF